MGIVRSKRPTSHPGGRVDVQALTGKSTGTTIGRYGVTFITVASATESATAGQYRFRLPTPTAGARKTISVNNATTRTVQVVAATSGAVFYGTTYNALDFTTGSTQGKSVELVGKNSTTWAVLSGSTAQKSTITGIAT